MGTRLTAGIDFEFSFLITENHLVPALLPESPEFQAMPRVLASGFMVGLIELACIKAIIPFLNWPEEQTVGIAFHLTHSAATPPGLTVRVQGTLSKVEGRRLSFNIVADDGVDIISQGTHDRFIILADRFADKVARKSSDFRQVLAR